MSQPHHRQAWNAQQYTTHASFVPELGAPVLEWLAPQSGEHILDLGCGDGALTLRLQDAGAQVLGVDASANMIAAAQARGLNARVMDGTALDFSRDDAVKAAGGFDAVFSNAALHWMLDPNAVIAGVVRALKPGGRFVGEMGGLGNVATLLAAMQDSFAQHPDFGPFENPWFFPSEADYAARLSAQGLRVQRMALIPRPTPLPSGVREWLITFSAGITRRLDTAQKERFLDDVTERLRPTLWDGSQWVADYVRLRFFADRSVQA